MTKRARYTGNAPGVRITWPPGAVYPEQEWYVEPGHWLPDDAPAKLRDELVKGPDWSEVEQTTPAASSSSDKNGSDS